MAGDGSPPARLGDIRGFGVESAKVSAERSQTVTFRVPEIADGAAMWRIARDSNKLDLNSSYAYLLWCRDFAATSVVARRGDETVGFVTGYRRPDKPDTFVVWQVAVAASAQGGGIAKAMLHHLADRLAGHGVHFLEATVTPDNEPSARLFSAFARDRDASMNREVLFDASVFPDDHESEVLLRIGPYTSSRPS